MTSADGDETPLEYAKSVVDRLVFVRGSIITSYAQVEFLLGDAFTKFRSLVDYAAVPSKFPYKVDSRISSIRSLYDIPGPLANYKVELESSVDKIASFTELRDTMAHGFSEIDYTGSKFHRLRFRLYKPRTGGDLDLVIYTTDLPHLERERERLRLYTGTMAGLFRKIYIETGIERESSFKSDLKPQGEQENNGL